MSATKLSNLQLELLELYAEQVSEEDFKDIKQLLSMYYAQKAIAAADEFWDEKGLNEKVMQQWLNKKMRTSYQAQKSHIEKQNRK